MRNGIISQNTKLIVGKIIIIVFVHTELYTQIKS